MYECSKYFNYINSRLFFWDNFSVSKFGVKGFGEALTADLDRQGKTGIHISTVYPGAVDTPMISNLSDYVDIIMGLILNLHKYVVKPK